MKFIKEACKLKFIKEVHNGLNGFGHSPYNELIYNTPLRMTIINSMSH